MQRGFHGPAHDATRDEVDHHCQIKPPLPGSQIGDIGDPGLVRAVHRKLPLELVRRQNGRPSSDYSGCFIASQRLDFMLFHQPCYTVQAARLTGLPKV